jgi:adenylosuccinate synthase
LPGFDADLPAEARDYLGFLSEFVGVAVCLIGVGPDREQTVWLDC